MMRLNLGVSLEAMDYGLAQCLAPFYDIPVVQPHHLAASTKRIVRGWSLMTVFGNLVMEMIGNIGYFDFSEALPVILAITSSSTATKGWRTSLLRNILLLCTVQIAEAI